MLGNQTKKHYVCANNGDQTFSFHNPTVMCYNNTQRMITNPANYFEV